jgi:hypothetical protein
MIMCLYQFKHRRNLAGNIGGGGQNRPWVLGTLIYEGVNLEIGGTIGLQQFLLYKHPFPHSHSILFLFSLLQLSSQNKTVLRYKNIGGGVWPPLPPSTKLRLCLYPYRIPAVRERKPFTLMRLVSSARLRKFAELPFH